MQKIAISGNIASGKSTVEKILLNNGYVVFDTDMIVHDILIDKPDVSEAFKEYDIFEYGRISREKLGNLIFNNKELKIKLENIVHPLVLEELNQIFKTYADEKYVFVSVPLLFEVRWEKIFDKVLFISADNNVRLKRLMERNNLSKEDALIRLNSQLSQDEKIKKSDYIIENNKNTEVLKKSVNDFINRLQKQ